MIDDGLVAPANDATQSGHIYRALRRVSALGQGVDAVSTLTTPTRASETGRAVSMREDIGYCVGKLLLRAK
jgi:hypothetical protein